MPLLDIRDLHVEFPTQGGTLHAVDGVSLRLEQGEVLGIVGESGSGKSVTMMALMGLIGWPGRVRAEHLRFAGPRPARHFRQGAARAGRQGRRDDLPGADDQPQPLLHHRLAADGDLAPAPATRQARGEEARDRIARTGRHSGGIFASRKLSASALGRHEPARDDRDGHRVQSAAADRRRADHCPRRDHPGPDPRPSAQPAKGARHGRWC